MSNGRTILVTGVAGFLGSHVGEALLRRGDRVIGIDNFDPFYPRALKEANLRTLAASSAFRFVEGDLCDEALVRAAMSGEAARTQAAHGATNSPAWGPVDGVIHLAAKAGVRPSIADPAGYMRANVLGTQVVLAAAHHWGAKRVVMASSSSVYGNAKVVPFSETHSVEEPISPYAASKRACELLAYTHHTLTRQPVACLRFFTVFGPRQRPDLAINLFLRRVARGEEIEMFGDGTSSRDYTFCGDIVSGVLAAYDRIDAQGYRVWNLGHSKPLALGEMIATIGRVVGREARVVRKPMQAGDVERTFADLTRSRAELGYSPAMSFEEGVRLQWEWMRGALETAPRSAG